MTRSSGFGYGRRYEFGKDNTTPSPCPTNYDTDALSPFKKKNSIAHGKSFGTAREVNLSLNNTLFKQVMLSYFQILAKMKNNVPITHT
jgi:hypothetical protein